jgi:hypothetical protein
MRPLLFALGFAAFLAPYVPAWADVVEIQRLNFGTWYIPGNGSVYTVTVNLDGSYSHSTQLTMVSPPQVGIYDIGGLTPNDAINSIDVSQNAPLENGAGSFDMDGFATSSSGGTDSSGRVTVTVGASAHTTGLGGGYPTGTYTGYLDLDFNLNF